MLHLLLDEHKLLDVHLVEAFRQRAFQTHDRLRQEVSQLGAAFTLIALCEVIAWICHGLPLRVFSRQDDGLIGWPGAVATDSSMDLETYETGFRV